MFATKTLLETPKKIVLIQERETFVNPIVTRLQNENSISVKTCGYNQLHIYNLIVDYKPTLIIIDVAYDNPNFARCYDSIRTTISEDCQLILLSDGATLNMRDIKLTHRQSTANKTNSSNIANSPSDLCLRNWISLPTNIGYRIANKDEIVMFNYKKREATYEKDRWEVLLNTGETFKLKTNTCSKDFLIHFRNNEIIMLSPQYYVNIKYFKAFETKSRRCLLHEPFEALELVASRNCMSEIKSMFEL